MYKVGKFEKVSFEQFYASMKDEFNMSEEDARRAYDGLLMPSRATVGSAGYDFKSPISFALEPSQTIKIPTGIRVHIEGGWWLGCLPRSGLGFKYQVRLANTVGVIDSDYYFSENEGHIFAKITNGNNEGKTLMVNEGEGFMQAIFIPFGITYDDQADGVRNGGFGSTGR